ncbi:MAG: pyroglutamyl-peptidase I [Candidatus Thorarchaeota archaeon]
MTTILVTGFEPFDGFETNPSAEVARAIDGKTIAGNIVAGIVLPLDYNTALDVVGKSIGELNPSHVLACGQANRAVLTIERIAVNALSTFKEDNYGNKPESDIIIENAPVAYYSNIDPHPLVERLRQVGIPAFVSYHAGIFGCNWLLFNLLHRVHTEGLAVETTFIHLPPLPIQTMEKMTPFLPTMSLDVQVRALEIIIENLPSAL